MTTPSNSTSARVPARDEAEHLETTHDSRLTAEQLAGEWVDRCIELLRPMDWAGRMEALMQLHDQLRNDFADFDLFCEVFPIFVGKTIDRLGCPPVDDLNQAHIYANSGDPAHRKAAGDWLTANGQPVP